MRTPIRRTKPLFEFVQIPNLVARDYRLSWRARGLLVELLSYPPGWETTVDDMVDRAKAFAEARGFKVEGREAMRTAANELVAVGYIKRRKFQNERGHWCTESELSEEPLLAFVLQETLSPGAADAQEPVSGATCGNTMFPAGQTGDGKPGVGFPAVGFPGRLTNTDRNTDTNNTGALCAEGAPDGRRPATGSRPSAQGGFAASGTPTSRLTKEQKQAVQAVRDLLPRDFDRALPVRTPRNIADDILAGLAVGDPQERTPEQMVQRRVLERWNNYWAPRFYAGEVDRPLGALRAMVKYQQECGDPRCEERVNVDTAEPCTSCAIRKLDRRADRERAREHPGIPAQADDDIGRPAGAVAARKILESRNR